MTSVIIQPTTVTANEDDGNASTDVWRTVFELPPPPQHGRQVQAPIPFEHVTKIWAPGAIVNQLTGPFAKYSTLSEVPRAMRAAPDATSWAGVQLWFHWSDPEEDAADGRVLCRFRQQMVWTVMHVAERLEILPSEMWMLIVTFVKHG